MSEADTLLTVGSGTDVFHTSPDCGTLDGVEPQEITESEARRRDLRECLECRGEVERPGKGRRSCPWCGRTRDLQRHLPCPTQEAESDE